MIYHHDPLHNDDFLDHVGEQVAQRFPNSLMAREGLTIQITPPNISEDDGDVNEPETSQKTEVPR